MSVFFKTFGKSRLNILKLHIAIFWLNIHARDIIFVSRDHKSDNI